MERFCQLLWRPRPASLLSEEKIKEIRKNMKKYSVQFDIKDRMTMSKVSKDILEKRKQMQSEFHEIVKHNEASFVASKKMRVELRNADLEEIESKQDIEEETIEFLVKEETTIIDEEEE